MVKLNIWMFNLSQNDNSLFGQLNDDPKSGGSFNNGLNGEQENESFLMPHDALIDEVKQKLSCPEST